MSLYKYRAYNQERKLMAGLVEAPNEGMAIEILKDKQLDIVALSEKTGGGLNFNLGRIKPKDIVVFSRQFAVLISSSVALVQSLKLLVDQTSNPKLKQVIGEIGEEVDGGARLSDAMAKRPKVFTGFYVNVVRSGETSGKLDEVLTYLADELEKDYDMTAKIKGAMIYPAFVFCGLGAVGVIMMVFVVPKLTAVLTESGMELPFATRVLIAVSDFMSSYWYVMIIGGAGAFFGLKGFAGTTAGKAVIDVALLKAPIFGRLFRLIYLVRFTRSLETLIKGGVNISKGLSITADVVSNNIFRQLILDTKKDVEDGRSMATSFADSKYVPTMVGQMIGIGEKTGRLDSILGSITRFYGREVENIVANLMTLMEPLIMVIIGIAVGMMVAAVIMPMYNMSSQFS